MWAAREQSIGFRRPEKLVLGKEEEEEQKKMKCGGKFLLVSRVKKCL